MIGSVCVYGQHKAAVIIAPWSESFPIYLVMLVDVCVTSVLVLWPLIGWGELGSKIDIQLLGSLFPVPMASRAILGL